jgi:hypothetical protein
MNSSFAPFIVVALALVAALSIVYIAWQLSSKEIQDTLEESLGRPGVADNPAEPDDDGQANGQR